MKKRLIDPSEIDYHKCIEDARDYHEVAIRGNTDILDWHYQKPFVQDVGHATYFNLMFAALNLVKAMRLPAHARVLEVGSGPGWLTQILLGLGYFVDALDPAEDFLDIAREKIGFFGKEMRMDVLSHVRFHAIPVEEADFAEATFDGIIFLDALHHVVHEKITLEKCFRFLKPNGVVGIHEGAWPPGNQEVEHFYREVYQKYGTLESPFTHEYLDFLLKETGFVKCIRYHEINGFIPVSEENRTILEKTNCPNAFYNIITANKPWYPGLAYSLDPAGETQAKWGIKSFQVTVDETGRRVSIDLWARNTGKTAWINQLDFPGCITITLWRGSDDAREEARCRRIFPVEVLPGEQVETTCEYFLPEDYAGKWQLDLVCEKYFFFSQMGMPPATVMLMESMERE